MKYVIIAVLFIWLAFCSLMLVVVSHDVYEAIFKPELFYGLWGGEHTGGMWSYGSQARYVGTGIAMILWTLAGIVIVYVRRLPRRSLLAAGHMLLTFVYFLYCFLTFDANT